MAYTNDQLKIISYIYKILNKEPEGIHKNTIRNQLLKSKICSKAAFNAIFEGLLALQKVNMDHEIVTIANGLKKIGIFRKNEYGGYISVPNSKKHFEIEKSVAEGYRDGEVVEFLVERTEFGENAVLLGKSKNKIKDEINRIISNKMPTTNTGENGKTVLLGRVVKLSHDDLIFIPNDRRIPYRHIPLLNDKAEQAKFENKLCLLEVDDIEQISLGGKIIEVKGDAGNPIHEYQAIAESIGAVLPQDDFEYNDEVSRLPNEVDTSDVKFISEEEADTKQKGHVVDLRGIDFVTVDPWNCSDMDDAIFSRFNENGDFEIYVARANLCRYIKPDSRIYKEYQKRAFTFYTPTRAYHVLPSQLASKLCSLNENVDRFAIVNKIIFDATTGEIKSSKIYDAVIRSRKKLSYDESQAIVDEFIKTVGDLQLNYFKTVGRAGTEFNLNSQNLMNKITSDFLWKLLNTRKMINFDSNKEQDVALNEDRDDVVDLKVKKRLDYEDVIQSFMIYGNEELAGFAHENGIEIPYRIHAAPSGGKIEKAKEFFRILGIKFDGELTAEKTRELIAAVHGTPLEEVVNDFLIQTQSRAAYSLNLFQDVKPSSEEEEEVYGRQVSHFALQSLHYCHSTSPIRRSPDYDACYNILAALHETNPRSRQEIQETIDIANERQIVLEQAERQLEMVNGVYYAKDHIGEKMHGVITKIMHTRPEDGFDEPIFVVVKNKETGISVNIPLSQLVGKSVADTCAISNESCAVYDQNGNVIIRICKPLYFIIDSVDTVTMTITGKLKNQLEIDHNQKYWVNENGFIVKKVQNTRYKKVNLEKKRNSSHKKEFPVKRDHEKMM
ncbi:MAG: RNB domain-containing ribonuclease [Clostridia bacterium]|nr:RNB domain-containing ribonuclease [Clostridia bacterium]